MRASVLFLSSLLLAGCGGEGGNSTTPLAPVGQAPSEAPAPSPAPTPAPSPTPTPAAYPDPADDGETIVVAEGDSISADYVGYYAGYYKSRHPELSYSVHAVSGSKLVTMAARLDEVQALNPDIVTVFIGANDLGGATSAQAYFDSLMAYAAPLRARGTRVLIATNLPVSLPANLAYTNAHNALREPLAVLLKAAVGKQIDGVIDFGGDPVMGQVSAPSNGQLYSDGLHPTDRNYQGAKGGHDYLYERYEAVMTEAVADLANRE